MKRFVEGEDRRQGALLPHCLDDYVTENNPVRVIEAFIDELDLATLGFDGVVPETTGRPAYHPATLLKIYLYGYLNRVQSSRRLERETQRNIELMWADQALEARTGPRCDASQARSDARCHGRAPADRRAPVRHRQGVDGLDPLLDPHPEAGQHRNEPPRPGLQHQAGDRDHRCRTAAASNPGLSAWISSQTLPQSDCGGGPPSSANAFFHGLGHQDAFLRPRLSAR